MIRNKSSKSLLLNDNLLMVEPKRCMKNTIISLLLTMESKLKAVSMEDDIMYEQ